MLRAARATEGTGSTRKVSVHLTIGTYEGGLGHKHLIAGHFGIDLKRDWVLTKDYLKRKTIEQIIALCNELTIFDDPKAKEFAVKKLKMKDDKYDRLQKKDLIRLIIDSGADLSGKVPKEILRVKK